MKTTPSGCEYDAWISSACMPSALLIQLLERFGDPGSCYEAFQLGDTEIRNLIPPRYQRLLLMNASKQMLSEMKKKMEKYSIGVIRINENTYPDLLRHIAEPPGMLFYRGNPECLNRRSIAVVGSRAASYTGQKAARRLAEALSRHGVSVISGLACGIDASAHQGCIEGGSPTIAVSGCGLDRIYPAENQGLGEAILKCGGIMLTEYAPGEKPAGWHFPVRNRIITGMARALILMEARIRSGSMTSVQHALDQGKDVFVYPGDPESECFSGNHQLLREGGIYFTSAEDILEDIGWLDNPIAVGQNSHCPAQTAPHSGLEAQIADALKAGSVSFEELLILTGTNPADLMSTLTIMQINGTAEALPGKKYRLKH